MATAKLAGEAVREDRGGCSFLTFPRLGDPKVLTHFVSTRSGGVSLGKLEGLNVSFKVGDDPVRVRENRELLSRAVGMDITSALTLDQVHSDKVVVLRAGDVPKGGESLGEADAVITDHKGVTLQVLVADCLPVLFYDPVRRVAGLAHAGWRGTLSHIAAKALLAMQEAFGTQPADVKALLGPCIGPCCYEVGQDVKKEFEGVFPWASEVFERSLGGAWKLDLASANGRQLIEVGLREVNLIRSGLCTVDHLDLFYSHRAEATPQGPTGRLGIFMRLNE